MGLAKKKMFGEEKRLPLQRFIDKGTLLTTDVAYAKLMTTKEEELPLFAAQLAAYRAGHLTFEKSLVEDSQLSALLPAGRFTLPKMEAIEDEIVAQTCRLLALPKRDVTPFATTEQENALQNALIHPISIITGGPGTGKTYTATQIIERMDTSTIACAPTGKAVTHLAAKLKTPVKSATLHSLLTQEHLPAKLIIVDECSMIDPILFARLLKAVPPQATLVLMGDVNQLSAVEGGSIFADLIDSKKIPTTTLTKSMRSDQTEILDLAASILNNTNSDIRNLNLGFSENRLEPLYQNLWNFVKDKDFATFRILSTLRKGPLGVDALNRYLFEKFSPTNYPILITRNDKRTGLANGDTGIITGQTAHINDKTYSIHELPPHEYAYCISVHKSQGSEYDEVLLLVPDGSESFGKEVIYTAVTRARHKLFIDGNPEQITKALARSSRKLSNVTKKLNTPILSGEVQTQGGKNV